MRKVYVLMALVLVLVSVNAFGMAEIKTGEAKGSYFGGVRWEDKNPIFTVGVATPIEGVGGLYAFAYGNVGGNGGGSVSPEGAWFWHVPIGTIPLYIGAIGGIDIKSPSPVTYVLGSYGVAATYNISNFGIWFAYKWKYKFDPNANVETPPTIGVGGFLNIK